MNEVPRLNAKDTLDAWLDSPEGQQVLERFLKWYEGLSDFDKIYYKSLESLELQAAATLDFLAEFEAELELSPRGKSELLKVKQNSWEILRKGAT